MTVDYLQRTDSVVLDSTGSGTVTLRPDVGQYWAPTFAMVSTLNKGGRTPGSLGLVQIANVFYVSPHAVLYMGPISAYNSTTLMDETYLGWGDTSSIISGGIVHFGEALTVKFDAGTPGDVAVFSIFGKSSSSLPDLVASPDVTPGARFSGSSGNAQVWDFNSELLAGPLNILNDNSVRVDLPNNTLAELLYVYADISTSAVAGNRQYYLEVQTRYNTSFLFTAQFVTNSNASQVASQNKIWSWAPGINNFATTTRVGCSMSQKIILPQGSIVQIFPEGQQAGDVCNQAGVLWRQYKTQSKLGYM